MARLASAIRGDVPLDDSTARCGGRLGIEVDRRVTQDTVGQRSVFGCSVRNQDTASSGTIVRGDHCEIVSAIGIDVTDRTECAEVVDVDLQVICVIQIRHLADNDIVDVPAGVIVPNLVDAVKRESELDVAEGRRAVRHKWNLGGPDFPLGGGV